MKLLAATLSFVFASTLAATAFGMGFHGLNGFWVLVAFGLGLIGAVLAWRQTAGLPEQRRTIWDWLMVGIFLLASFRAFFWLIYVSSDDICVLSPNNLGDISLHLCLIHYLASGIPFWPASPILSGVPLTYPLGADLFNALTLILGADIYHGLILTGFAGAVLTCYALWRWGGAFGLAALLFNGGLAGFVFLTTFQADDFQKDLVWKNLFLSMFVTQRGLLVALPAALLLLTAWRSAFFRQRPLLPFWLQVLLYAVLPLFNFHAFLFLSVVLVAIFLGQPSSRGILLWLVGISFVPATGVVCLITNFFSVKSGLQFDPGWIPKMGAGSKAWIWDFGLTLPLCAMLAVLLIRKCDLEARCFVWAAVSLFMICCLVTFAPWPWDNMKLIVWSWLAIAPYLWTKLLADLHPASRAAICFVLFFSGAISLIGGLDGRHGYPLAKRSELDAWRMAVAKIPPDARFACVPDFNHPLILLGRAVACGYEGHLWSHGLKYKEKYALLQSSLRDQARWPEAAQQLGVSWFAYREQDRNIFPGLPWKEGSEGMLFDVRPLLRPIPGIRSNLILPPRSVDSF